MLVAETAPEPETEHPVAVPPDFTVYVTGRPEVAVEATERVPLYGPDGLGGVKMVWLAIVKVTVAVNSGAAL
jgi:hypothetical protein